MGKQDGGNEMGGLGWYCSLSGVWTSAIVEVFSAEGG
jgi:hypothetical protein